MLSTQHNSVQLFKSYAGAKMIKPILVALWDLSGWYFLTIAQPSLLLSSPCHLKYGRHVLHRRFNNGSILLNSHELLILILLLNSTKFFFPKSLQPEETVEPAWRASPVEPVWKLRFIDGFKFSTWHGKCVHRPDSNYSYQYCCLRNVSITKVWTWIGTMFQNLDPWLPNIFQP